MVLRTSRNLNLFAVSPDCRILGAFYTPFELASWVATEMLERAAVANMRVRHVVDPACGDGALLDAMRREASDQITLTGIDINAKAASQCRANLGHKANILVGDALDPSCPWGDTSPDAVIINPPWGGVLAQDRQFYQNHKYRLATGQFDISDLFVERALTVVQPGTVLGFILPDAVFQPGHQALRELLLEHTLLLIARLGEGIFDGVCRSTVVIVLRRGRPETGHVVECLQLPASQRKMLGRGELSFRWVKELYSHRIPQTRFAANPSFVFNITQGETDYDIYRKFSLLPVFNWTQRVHLGRGVEIGKRGVTVCCAICGKHRAAPAVDTPTKCPTCDALICASAPRHTIIANSSNGPEWCPLIVGEDVDRYTVASRRFIQLGVPGIKYKPMEHFAARKLLIRKTGVGLRAAVDESGSATVQAVFYAITAIRKQEWILDYLQGIINSRPLLAWYLRWSGENQWRSHPYVTPKVLKKLPIPDPYINAHITEIAYRIAAESKKARSGLDGSDYVVDNLVCLLYDLSPADISWIGDVLTDTEDQLEYFRQMRMGAINGILSTISEATV